MQLHFYKYQGTGNDFIILNNRTGSIDLSQAQIRFLCDRKFGIGADGLMLLNTIVGYDFEMKYYNADGSESTMCGNGGRCLTRFAYDSGIQKEQYSFLAIDGPHEAKLANNGWIHLKMIDVSTIIKHGDDFVLNTGSPHYIKQVNELDTLDVFTEGRSIRYNDEFGADGINVNFVCQAGECIKVRTYERGVEDETLSCGTGVTAAALAFAGDSNGFNKINIETKGGKLTVEFNKIGPNNFNNIWLCGPAVFVFEGDIDLNLTH
ncbi:MAG: diaminopimelate epimerase [Sphingobacteriia bacterium]|nr:MAG: diaminopimelate epimerase [Sphingobacteriia bacterium]